MIAEDLFTSKIKQVFSARTGKWLGAIDTSHEFNFDDPADELPQEEVNPINQNQLKLF